MKKLHQKPTQHRALLRFAAVIVALVAITNNTHAQKLTLDYQKTPLLSVLKDIQKQTPYTFVYNNSLIDVNKEVSITASNEDITSVLDKLFINADISYKFIDKQISLSPKVFPQNATAQNVAQNNQTQDIRVQGTVVDEVNEPLQGVVVSIKGKNKINTYTDAAGKFTLTGIAPNETLDFFLVGYESQEIELNGKAVLTITLKAVVRQLEDIVITGYQTISKERTTGSYSIVSSDKMERRSMPNISSMLEGQVAGLYTSPSGDISIRGMSTINATDNPLYVIDGIPIENSVLMGTALNKNVDLPPLVNPEDIESITVLKDAAAASIYGARSANGVIVIKTKSAKIGKVQIGFSSTLTWREKPDLSYLNIVNANQMIDLEQEFISRNPFLTNPTDAIDYRATMMSHRYYPTPVVKAMVDQVCGDVPEMDSQQEVTNLINQYRSNRNLYQDDVTKYGMHSYFAQQYNLNLRQSSTSNNFTASVTYWDANHVDYTPNNNNNRIGINFGNSTKVTKWLQAEVGAYLYYSKENSGNYLDPRGADEYSIIPYILGVDASFYNPMPYEKLADDNGHPLVVRNILGNMFGARSAYETNIGSLLNMDFEPLKELYRNPVEEESITSRVYSKLKFNVHPVLNFELMGQYEIMKSGAQQVYDKDSYRMRELVNAATVLTPDPYLGFITANYNIPTGDGYRESNTSTNSYIFRGQANYSQTFKDRHNITAIVGTEVREVDQYYSHNVAFGYDPQIMQNITNVDWKTIAAGLVGALNENVMIDSDDIFRNFAITNRYVSLYGNASYTYNAKYSLTGSIRRDMSNLFGTNPKYQRKPLWSIGASWRISEEAFMKTSWIDDLKLRVTYGINGNVAKNSSPYLIADYSSKSVNYRDQVRGVITSPANPNLRWERSETFNIGLDAQLFNNRLAFTLDLFNKYSKDLLIDQSIDPAYGFTRGKVNNGELDNKGIELSINGMIINSRNFGWRASLVGSYIKSTLVHYNNQPQEALMYLAGSTLVVDKPYAALMAFKWAGLDNNGNPQVYDPNGNPTIRSFNLDPNSVNALVYMGTVIPPFTASFTNNFTYKGFELSAMLICNAGHVMRRDVPNIEMVNDLFPEVTSSEIENRWKKAGDVTTVPRVSFSYDGDIDLDGSSRQLHYQYADINVVDASYIKLRNLSLTYHLPSSLLSKASISGARIMFSVENLATFEFNKYGIDPEHHASNGVRYLKNGPSYILGIQLNF